MKDDEKMIKAFGAIGMTIGGMFFFIILSTFMGGLAAWVTGLVFGDTILPIFTQLGIRGVTMFQVGCFLGFIGGYLKTKVGK